MIKSFRNRLTAELFNGLKQKKGFPEDLVRTAYRKLLIVDAASVLGDLKSPPSNHLEALVGDRKGQHSVRINDKWRICFIWRSGDAYEVEVTDYH